MSDSKTETTLPVVVPRAEHDISRAQIAKTALKVLYRLRAADYEAYLVGGGVRDLLLGQAPKDFDVATDAAPEQVRSVFGNCRLIGRRFRLAHVYFGQEIVEVATFRAGPSADEDQASHLQADGLLLRDNIYGSLEDDAFRRDFTVNALYYNIRDFGIYDYVGGLDDLRAGLLRMIGEPAVRYREDPVRMLRAARFAAKLGFTIEPATAAPIETLGHLLHDVPPARLFDESLKLFLGGQAAASYRVLHQYDLFGRLYPAAAARIEAEGGSGVSHQLLRQALENTDERLALDKPVTPTFLFAALAYPALRAELDGRPLEAVTPEQVLQAGDRALDALVERVALPRRYRAPLQEIWQLQPRFSQRNGKRALRLLAHPRFRAAYDFLLLRTGAGEADPALADWWTEIQQADADRQQGMLDVATGEGGNRSGRRRRRRRRSGAAGREGA